VQDDAAATRAGHPAMVRQRTRRDWSTFALSAKIVVVIASVLLLMVGIPLVAASSIPSWWRGAAAITLFATWALGVWLIRDRSKDFW
jgi:protein-S-isoprenylcysteine O-methyltransferase Ste14